MNRFIAWGGALIVNLLLLLTIDRLTVLSITALPRGGTLRPVEFVRLQALPAAFSNADVPPPPPLASPAPPTVPAETFAPDGSASAVPVPAPLPTTAPVAPDMPPLALVGEPRVPAVAGAGDAVEMGHTTTSGRERGRAGAPPAAPSIVDIEFNPTVLRKPAPSYPAQALRDGIEGEVEVEFTIDANGVARDPTILESRPPTVFDTAVLDAVRTWRFLPTYRNGRAVPQRARQTVRFTLKAER